MASKMENADRQLSNTHIVLTSLCAGAVAGALAKTSIAPLDRTKINFQISDKKYSFKRAIKFLVKTYKCEGFFALWRGNSATMARIIPHAAIQFTAHEQWKRILGVDQPGKHEPKRLFLAGSLAGATSQSITYPLDFARARMAVTNKSKYASLWDVFKTIYQYEGARTFYRGYIPTITGVIPYAGVSFFIYDSLKQFYADHMMDSGLPYSVATAGFGALAGMLGQCSSYPLDIIRRRMQTDTQGLYTTVFGTAKIVYREGIITGFYKGLSMNWIKGPIAVGISFSCYDNIKNSLRKLALSVSDD